MNGRRAVIGLSLLSALVFCAFSASSAWAIKGTTGFTCDPVPEGTGNFTDAHCDKAGKGNFSDANVVSGEAEVEFTNEKTASETAKSAPSVLRGVIFGVNTEISCAVVSGKAKVANVVEGGKMEVVGSGVTSKFSTCTVIKPAKCTLKEANLTAGVTSTSYTERETSGIKNTMGAEFKPAAGKPFSTFTLEGKECALKEKAIPVEGTALATGGTGPSETSASSGATLVFTKEMTEKTLKVGESAVSLESTTTVRKVGGNPVIVTTLTE